MIHAEVSVKQCTHCNQILPIDLFTKNTSVLGGYGGHCKPCHNHKNRNRHYKRTKDADYRASTLLRAAKGRHDTVTITKEWVAERIERGFCEVSKLPFELDLGKPARAYTPSLDRIDPNKGYTPDNTQVVCWIYNRAKGVDGHDCVMILAKALVASNDN